MPPTVKVATLPARSVAVPITDIPRPFQLMTVGLETPSRPDSVSPPLKLTVTLALYQPAALGARSGEPVSTGAVLSMFTPLIVLVVVLPARSVTVKLLLWPAPSLVKVNEPVAGEEPFRPERLSLAE
jgi:hypothetical protein